MSVDILLWNWKVAFRLTSVIMSRMKNISVLTLGFFLGLTSWLAGQDIDLENLADLIFKMDAETENRWIFRFEPGVKKLRLTSRETVVGDADDGAQPPGDFVEECMEMEFKITSDLTNARRIRLAIAETELDLLTKSMGEDVQVQAGLRKGSFRNLTRKDWVIYLKREALMELIEELRPPVYSFGPLKLREISKERIYLTEKSLVAKQLLEDQKKIIKLLEPLPTD